MTSISIEPFSLSLKTPFRSATKTITARNGFAIRVTDAGNCGVGEATPLSGWTESYDECEATLRAVQSTDITHPWELSFPTAAPAARHGLTLALFDVMARQHELPLATYLTGEQSPDSIPVQATIGNEDISKTVGQAVDAVEAGYSVIKCKLGRETVNNDIKRLAAVREAIGDAPELRVDANRSWSRAQASEALDALASLRVSYVEEPLDTPDRSSIADLSDLGVRIALDETLTMSTPEKWLDLIDVVVLKPMALGGIDIASDIATRARAAGVETVVSNTIDGVIARTAAVHVAAALPGNLAAGLATAGLFESGIAPDPAPVVDGSMRVPTSPGIGTMGVWERGNER